MEAIVANPSRAELIAASSLEALLRTYSGVVYPLNCDAMGHMNVQYYVAAFDQAMWHLVHSLGYRAEWQTERSQGWADVQHTVSFSKELKIGSLFYINSNVGRVGQTSLTTLHKLYDMAGNLSAANEIKSVYFDLKERRSLPLPDVIRLEAEQSLFRLQDIQPL
ncbi:thioesterase family protein [Rhizobium sp. NZLR1]|uniref:acyl-CoA thioesterase n=1 Tax=Rhizobium sp. NZLR1 TaxID=2731096 RepID=UPI001C832D34|nr:thioesterase family protein [Rhizobium sp. NZLR1]